MSDEGQNQGATPGGDGGNSGGEAKWYSAFENPELRGFVENKGWKGPDAAVESYRQLEKTIGVPPERLLKLPEKADDPAWGEIKGKLGFAAPKEASEYGIKAPDGVDASFADFMSGTMHKHGVPTAMAQALAADYIKFGEDAIKAEEDAAKQRSEADMATLRTDWGERFPESSELARRAVKEFGDFAKLDGDSLNAMEGAMGTANFLRMWAAIGSKTGEAKFIDGGDSNVNRGAMSPDAAKARIVELTHDREWGARKLAGGQAENAEWTRLHRIAYPEAAKN